MPPGGMSAVYMLGISHVDGIEYTGKGSCITGHHNKMHMVAHQTIGKNIKPVFFCILVHPTAIKSIIAFLFKDILPVVTALGNVVGYIGYDDPCLSWHGIEPYCRISEKPTKRRYPFYLRFYAPSIPPPVRGGF